MTGPLITSAMWKEDRQKLLNLAIAHHLQALQSSMFALRDENGNRPDFDLEDMVNAIYESMVLSRAEFAKYHEMVAENQRKIDAERLNKVEKLEFANGELRADLNITGRN